MKQEKIQQNMLVIALPPDGDKHKASLRGIALFKGHGDHKGMWAVRFGFNNGLTTRYIPEKKLIALKILSWEEMTSEAHPAGFKEIHPDTAFEKYFKEIKPKLEKIADQLDLEGLTCGIWSEDVRKELRTLSRHE
jgi:hypothetical protein